MSNRWWNPFDGMEQVAFKRTDGGYLYRAPNPWLFGRGRYYLVNETQKTELMAHHRRMMQFTFWAIVVAAGIGGPFAGRYAAGNAWLMLGVSLAVGLAIGAALNLQLARKVGRIVAGLTPASGRITQRDAFKTQVAVFSFRSAVAFAVLDLVLFALVVSTAVFGSKGWDVIAVVGTLLFGAGALYFTALCVAKRRQAAV